MPPKAKAKPVGTKTGDAPAAGGATSVTLPDGTVVRERDERRRRKEERVIQLFFFLSTRASHARHTTPPPPQMPLALPPGVDPELAKQVCEWGG